MAGSGSLNPVPISSSRIDIQYSVNAQYTAVIDVIDVATHGGVFYKRITIGTGFHQSTYALTGLQPDTQYRFGLYDYISQAQYWQLDLKYASTKTYSPPPPPPPPPPNPKGSLSAITISDTEIKLNYSYSDGSSVSLFRGSTLVKTFGSGSGSGVYYDDSLSPNTSYSYYLRNGTSTGSTLLASSSAKTFITPTGDLSVDVIEANSVILNYSYSEGTNVSIFKESTLIETLGSGTDSGQYTLENLLSQTEYTIYLRNGNTPESDSLGEVTLTTLPPAEGTITATAVDSETIDIVYSFTDCENVSLFNGNSRIKTFGSGSGSGTYRETGLSSNSKYDYYLRNGTSIESLLLSSSSATTLKEARRTTVEQGKILPLNSLLTIFDSGFTSLGLLEDYKLLLWNFRYRSVDDFTLYINRYNSNTDLLARGNVIALYVAGYYRAAMIEQIRLTLDQEGKISENYEIKGRGLDGLLMERIALHNVSTGTGYDTQDTYAESAMRHYVNYNCMDATDSDRNYDFLYLADDKQRGGNVKYNARFQMISEILEEIGLISGLGWGVILDPTNKRLILEITEGLDRSFGNADGNSPVTFSSKFGNIKVLDYMESSINSKNVVYVAGQGEANLRTIEVVTKDSETYTGLNRREFLADARDLETTDKLALRGLGRLEEKGDEIVVEIENLQAGPFKFGSDFNLGDIITAEHPEIVSANLRIIESQLQISANNLIQNNLILGKEYPDLFKITKQNNKNIYPEVRK